MGMNLQGFNTGARYARVGFIDCRLPLRPPVSLVSRCRDLPPQAPFDNEMLGDPRDKVTDCHGQRSLSSEAKAWGRLLPGIHKMQQPLSVKPLAYDDPRAGTIPRTDSGFAATPTPYSTCRPPRQNP